MNGLLEQKDFQRFSSGNKQYVFLTGNQQTLEITTPEMDTYFKMCADKQVDLPLNNLIVAKLTNVLEGLKTIPTNNHSTSKQVMLTLNTTHGCNMACKYCFASTLKDRRNVMPLSVVQKSIQNLIENNKSAEQYIIYFFGGEPLLHKQFIREAVEIAKEEILSKHNKKVCFLLNTNATLMDKATLAFFKKENFTITVSIDGPEHANDLNRIFLNGRSSFNRAMKGIDLLKEYGIRFNLRATFNPKATYLVETFKFFEGLKVPYSYAFAISAKEKELCETHFNDEDIARFDKELETVMGYLLSKIANDNTVYCTDFFKKLETLKYRSVRLHGCEAGRNSLIVNESGEYYVCQNMLPFPETAVGNLSKGIDTNKLNQFSSKEVKNLPICQQCWARYLCGGGCEVERYLAENETDEFTQRCKLTQLEWKHFIQTYIKMNDLINNKFNNKKELNYGRIEKVRA